MSKNTAEIAKRTVFIDDAEVPVRYDYQDASPGHFDNITGHNNCPPTTAEVTITELFINGEWVSPGYFERGWLVLKEVMLLEEILEEQDSDAGPKA